MRNLIVVVAAFLVLGACVQVRADDDQNKSEGGEAENQPETSDAEEGPGSENEPEAAGPAENQPEGNQDQALPEPILAIDPPAPDVSDDILVIDNVGLGAILGQQIGKILLDRYPDQFPGGRPNPPPLDFFRYFDRRPIFDTMLPRGGNFPPMQPGQDIVPPSDDSEAPANADDSEAPANEDSAPSSDDAEPSAE